jgi:hypothetical protein
VGRRDCGSKIAQEEGYQNGRGLATLRLRPAFPDKRHRRQGRRSTRVCEIITKHIDVRYHFIRWVVENDTLWLVYCPTAGMLADTLTKALPSPNFKHFAACLGLRAVREGVSELRRDVRLRLVVTSVPLPSCKPTRLSLHYLQSIASEYVH